VFTLQVTGLQPDQDVVVETSFVQLGRPTEPGWELRVPQTVGPRYSRIDEAGSPAASGQPLAVWRDPGHRFALDLVVRESGAIASSTHALTVGSNPDGSVRVRLRDGSVLPDRDVVLSRRSKQFSNRPSLEVLVHEAIDEGTRYFLALVASPAAGEPAKRVDREIALLVDQSGSMARPKWEACRWGGPPLSGRSRTV